MSHAQYPELDATVKSIASIYNAVPQGFSVGGRTNSAGENLKSLAILGFASLNGLTTEQTLPLFGEAWQEVQNDPDGLSHGNIRALMQYGIESVTFDSGGLSLNPRLQRIVGAWEDLSNLTPDNATDELRRDISWVMDGLDCGMIRAAMKLGNVWCTNDAVKMAVLLSFRLEKNEVIPGVATNYFDKVPLKFAGMTQAGFEGIGARVVPPAVARRGSYIARGVILMPSYVNIGAYVDSGTMVDTWATVGSCAQIGKNVHLSGGVGIGGVLEPVQATPTIIEDNCFIGARSEIVEGVIVGEGSVISMGVYIGQSTKIYDRETGTVSYGRVPPGSVVVAGNLPASDGSHSLYCAVIVKHVDAQTRAKVGINELLRDI
jgi:2,3,4,5-tetrahydropyridine-2-carboxylate N-succinyltransferase